MKKPTHNTLEHQTSGSPFAGVSFLWCHDCQRMIAWESSIKKAELQRLSKKMKALDKEKKRNGKRQ